MPPEPACWTQGHKTDQDHAQFCADRRITVLALAGVELKESPSLNVEFIEWDGVMLNWSRSSSGRTLKQALILFRKLSSSVESLALIFETFFALSSMMQGFHFGPSRNVTKSGLACPKNFTILAN